MNPFGDEETMGEYVSVTNTTGIYVDPIAPKEPQS